MATTQELLDLKYGRQLLEDRARLSELFSESILGNMFNQNRNKFSDIVTATYLNLGYQRSGVNIFKGLYLMTNLETIYGASSIGSEINIASLVKLKSVNFGYCTQLTTVGCLNNLILLEQLILNDTLIDYIGDLAECNHLININLSNTNLIYVYLNFSNLQTAIFSNCKFDGYAITETLSRAHAAKAAGSPLTMLNLGGANMAIPTGGAANADYVWLTNNGVTVTIRTA